MMTGDSKLICDATGSVDRKGGLKDPTVENGDVGKVIPPFVLVPEGDVGDDVDDGDLRQLKEDARLRERDDEIGDSHIHE